MMVQAKIIYILIVKVNKLFSFFFFFFSLPKRLEYIFLLIFIDFIDYKSLVFITNKIHWQEFF